MPPSRARGDGYLSVAGPCSLEFPRDHGAHDGYQTEWWYYTGNVESSRGEPYGFQLTFFRTGIRPPGTPELSFKSSAWRTRQLFMAHAALTDVKGGLFFFDERLARGALGLAGVEQADGVTRVAVMNWAAELKAGGHRLRADAASFSLDLDCVPVKAPVSHGIEGYSRKGERQESASCYYSFSRLRTKGTISVGGTPLEVAGTAWMDHEFSTAPLEPDLTGWDWFSIQLGDGTELMMFLLRKKDGSLSPYSSGTFVDVEGEGMHLTQADFQVTIQERWKSLKTGAVYPSRWRIRVPSARAELELVPNLADQELITRRTTRVAYWEGSVSVRGFVSGRPVSGKGYVEMTGYAAPFDLLR
jgi:predicted secreted hydrolase